MKAKSCCVFLLCCVEDLSTIWDKCFCKRPRLHCCIAAQRCCRCSIRWWVLVMQCVMHTMTGCFCKRMCLCRMKGASLCSCFLSFSMAPRTQLSAAPALRTCCAASTLSPVSVVSYSLHIQRQISWFQITRWQRTRSKGCVTFFPAGCMTAPPTLELLFFRPQTEMFLKWPKKLTSFRSQCPKI